MAFTLAELAHLIQADLEGDGRLEVTGIAGLSEAQPGDISFVANARYARKVAETRATAIVVARNWDRPSPVALLRVEHPDRAFALVAERFAPPPPEYQPGIHPSAVIAADAILGPEVTIGPHCIVEAGAEIGARTRLLGLNVVGQAARIGCDGLLYPLVSLRERVRLGDRVIVHNGAVIGSDGFGYTLKADGARVKIPQIGTVEVGDDVEIGANVAIDRARFGATRIGNRVKIDNLVQIAHNVTVGADAVIVAQVGISGSTQIGARAILAGQAGIAGHLQVGAGAVVGAQAGVTKDVPAGSFVSGYPAAPHARAMRLQALLARLPEWRERLEALEAQVAALAPRP